VRIKTRRQDEKPKNNNKVQAQLGGGQTERDSDSERAQTVETKREGERESVNRAHVCDNKQEEGGEWALRKRVVGEGRGGKEDA